MSLTKGENSYVTVLEADSYFETRLYSDVWTNASSAQKESSLVTATEIIDSNSFVGQATGESLAFPRDMSYFDPRKGAVVTLEDSVPDRILQATKELALYLLQNEAAVNPQQSAESIVIDTLEFENISRIQRIPDNVMKLLRPLLENSSGMWWRAN